MTGLMKRIFRRRAADESPRAGVASLFRGRARGERLPGYRRLPSFGLARLRGRLPWSAPAPPPASPADATQETELIGTSPAAPAPSFKDRSRLRRRLRFLRRTRELGFRDVGGLIFDMRRFARNRPDLLDAKLDALLAVDQELRALERILDDRRPIHELREPGISACPRCGALHASESNFCPECGLQISGPRAMGELGGSIAAPPEPPPVPAEPAWSWPSAPPIDEPTTTVTRSGPEPVQPTAPTVMQPEPDQPTTSYAPALSRDAPRRPPPVRDLSADTPPEYAPAHDEPAPPASKRKAEPGRPPPRPKEEPKRSPPKSKEKPGRPPPKSKEEPGRPPPKPKEEPRQPPPGRKDEPGRRPSKPPSAPAQETAADDKPVPGEEPTETRLPRPPLDGS